MRLDRFISQASGHSRSQVRAMIRAGRVSVDGSVVRDVAWPTPEPARISLDGVPVAAARPVYLMLHKPSGVLSATRDAHQATVMQILPPVLRRRVHPVGRLDKATTGLLLLTDDGQWSHRISSPRHHCAKRYRAHLAEPLVADAEERLALGLELRGDRARTRPARLQRVGPNEVCIEVTEGRYHLVRRLFAALGNRVEALHRERIGGLELDPALAPGQWRRLSAPERAAVLSGGMSD